MEILIWTAYKNLQKKMVWISNKSVRIAANRICELNNFNHNVVEIFSSSIGSFGVLVWLHESSDKNEKEKNRFISTYPRFFGVLPISNVSNGCDV